MAFKTLIYISHLILINNLMEEDNNNLMEENNL